MVMIKYKGADIVNKDEVITIFKAFKDKMKECNVEPVYIMIPDWMYKIYKANNEKERNFTA